MANLKPIKSKSKEESWFTKIVDFLTETGTEFILNGTLVPLIDFVRNEIFNMLNKIQVGRLRVITVNNEVYEFGQGSNEVGEDQVIILKAKSDKLWLRIALFSDMGLAESFMFDECEINDVTSFLKLLVHNRNYLTSHKGTTDIAGRCFSMLNYFSNTKFVNSIRNTLSNISAHYDLGNDMFALFLDPTLTYSCPIWKEVPEEEYNNKPSLMHVDKKAIEIGLEDEFEELHKAQLRKLHTIIKKAKLRKEDHVLEIGSGWGALSIEAVKTTGCRVTTLTLSIEQKVMAEERIADAGYSDKIKVILMDYRDLLSQGVIYDKIISIEMIEAVGKEYLSTYFNCCHSVLKKDGGIMVLQGITIHESRYEDYCNNVDFIQKYIFPGGHTPSITALVNAIQNGTKGELIVNDINNIGMHYTRALRLWRQKFLLNFEKIRSHDPIKYDDVFKRTWMFYLCYCEAGFATHCIGDVIMVLSRPNNLEIHDGILM